MTSLTPKDGGEAAWQSVETAPEMKTILLFAVTDVADDGQVKNWRMGTGFKDRHNGWNWEGRIQKPYEIPPTHWMPLPKPPLAEGQPEGPNPSAGRDSGE